MARPDAIDAVLGNQSSEFSHRQTGASPERASMALTCAWLMHRPLRKEIADEQRSDLDFRMESRGCDVLELEGQSHRPAQSHLVDRRRAYRIFGLADLEHRRDQAAAGRLPLHDRSTVSTGGGAG